MFHTMPRANRPIYEVTLFTTGPTGEFDPTSLWVSHQDALDRWGREEWRKIRDGFTSCIQFEGEWVQIQVDRMRDAA